MNTVGQLFLLIAFECYGLLNARERTGVSELPGGLAGVAFPRVACRSGAEGAPRLPRPGGGGMCVSRPLRRRPPSDPRGSGPPGEPARATKLWRRPACTTELSARRAPPRRGLPLARPPAPRRALEAALPALRWRVGGGGAPAAAAQDGGHHGCGWAGAGAVGPRARGGRAGPLLAAGQLRPPRASGAAGCRRPGGPAGLAGAGGAAAAAGARPGGARRRGEGGGGGAEGLRLGAGPGARPGAAVGPVPAPSPPLPGGPDRRLLGGCRGLTVGAAPAGRVRSGAGRGERSQPGPCGRPAPASLRAGAGKRRWLGRRVGPGCRSRDPLPGSGRARGPRPGPEVGTWGEEAPAAGSRLSAAGAAACACPRRAAVRAFFGAYSSSGRLCVVRARPGFSGLSSHWGMTRVTWVKGAALEIFFANNTLLLHQKDVTSLSGHVCFKKSVYFFPL